GSRTSQRSASVSTPSPAISAAACSQRSSLRAQSTTFAPPSARACAMWRPMPLPPPVTMAVLPVRSKSSLASTSLCRQLGHHPHRLDFASLAEQRRHAALPPGIEARRDALAGPDQRDLVDERVRYGGDRLALLAVEVQLLHRGCL